eukprot:4923278-Pyramimonas_sp.AAC.1
MSSAPTRTTQTSTVSHLRPGDRGPHDLRDRQQQHDRHRRGVQHQFQTTGAAPLPGIINRPARTAGSERPAQTHRRATLIPAPARATWLLTSTGAEALRPETHQCTRVRGAFSLESQVRRNARARPRAAVHVRA